MRDILRTPLWLGHWKIPPSDQELMIKTVSLYIYYLGRMRGDGSALCQETQVGHEEHFPHRAAMLREQGSTVGFPALRDALSGEGLAWICYLRGLFQP